MVRNTRDRESSSRIHHQQGQFIVLFVNYLLLNVLKTLFNVLVFLLRDISVTGEMLLYWIIMKETLLTETLR